MKAIILVAGKGKRLRPDTNELPKPLVPVNDKPMVHYLLDAVKKIGINEAYILTGYLADKVTDMLGSEYNGIKINYVNVDTYETTNNICIASFIKGFVNKTEDDFLLLEGDLVVDDDFFENMINMEGDIAAIGAYKDFMDGTSVEKNGEYIEKMYLKKNQKADPDYTHENKYKTVNIYKFTNDFLRNRFIPESEKFIEKHGSNDYYEIVLKKLIEEDGVKMKYQIMDDYRWYEIDNPEDLIEAEKLMK